MTLILECREKIKRFYRLNSVIILPILKFLVAFIALNGVNTMMGYMPRLDNVAIVLIASLACSFLPAGCLTLLCALFSLAHLYSLSLETAIMGLCVYLILFLMLFRFAPKDSYVIIMTPLLFALKIPYVVPIAVGLVSSPVSAVSVACGVVVYYFLTTIVGCAPTVRAMGDDMADKIRFLLETVAGNKSVLVIAAAFAITVIVVYLIRRMSVEYAWTIAMVAGVMINLVLLLIGDLIYDINLSMGSAILGSIAALLVAKVIEFFRFCVDYTRTEHAQFEDDEYYYYVKAVPKMNVAASTKTVKKINSQNGVSLGSRTSSSVTRSASGSSDRAESDYEQEEYTGSGYGREGSSRRSYTERSNAVSGRRNPGSAGGSQRSSMTTSSQSGAGVSRPATSQSGAGVSRPASSQSGAGVSRPASSQSGAGVSRPVSSRNGAGVSGSASSGSGARPGAASGMSSGGGYGTTRSMNTNKNNRTGEPPRRSSYSSQGVTGGNGSFSDDDSDDYEELF